MHAQLSMLLAFDTVRSYNLLCYVALISEMQTRMGCSTLLIHSLYVAIAKISGDHTASTLTSYLVSATYYVNLTLPPPLWLRISAALQVWL